MAYGLDDKSFRLKLVKQLMIDSSSTIAADTWVVVYPVRNAAGEASNYYMQVPVWLA